MEHAINHIKKYIHTSTHTYIYTHTHTSKLAKIKWGLRHEVLKRIYEGAIRPLILDGAQVGRDAMKYTCNRRKYIRAQRMINLRIAKAFCTTSY